MRRCRFVMLPGHSTDHRALVTLLHTGEKGNIVAYRKKLQQCPLKIERGRMSSDEKWQIDLTVLKARMNGEELTVGDVMDEEEYLEDVEEEKEKEKEGDEKELEEKEQLELEQIGRAHV